MRGRILSLVAVLLAVLPSSCSAPAGSAAVGDLNEGMSKEEARSVMRSHGLKPEDSRRRPSSGWKIYGQDPFAAGSMASEFEEETGQSVEWADVYYIAGETGSTVINLYYDGSGRLLR